MTFIGENAIDTGGEFWQLLINREQEYCIGEVTFVQNTAALQVYILALHIGLKLAYNLIIQSRK